MTDKNQSALFDDPPQEPEGNMVFIVASNYEDDPHPHIEGVYSDEEDADEMMERCSRVVGGPHPVAWQLIEAEVDGEVTYR